MDGVEYQTVSRRSSMNCASVARATCRASSEMTCTLAPCLSGRVEVEDREIEVKRRVAAEAIDLRRLEDARAPVDEAQRVVVREHHAFGDAGRAGGVEDVGEIARAPPVDAHRRMTDRLVPCERAN